MNDMVGGVTVTIDEPGMADRDPALVCGETVTLQADRRRFMCAIAIRMYLRAPWGEWAAIRSSPKNG